MRLVFLLLSSIAAFGVTASPTEITVYMRQTDTALTPTPNFPVVPITISGSGSWGITRGGTLATACPSQSGYCINLSTSSDPSGAAALPTGSGSGTVYLYGRGVWQTDLTPGTRTGTFAIGTSTVTVTLVTVARNAWSAFGYRGGYPSGCSNTNARYADADTCVITTERPTSVALSIPATGGSYTDPQFGSIVTRLTSSKNNVSYSASTAFSASEKYVLTWAVGADSAVNVYDRALKTLAYASVPVTNIDKTAWDPSNDEVLWFMDGGQVKYRTLNTSTTTVAADYSSAFGARPALTNLSIGGTEDITDDGWVAAISGTESQICAIHIVGLTPLNQESRIFCADYSAVGVSSVDFPQMTQVDSESGKRYMLIIGSPVKPVWSIGSSANFEYYIPEGSYGIASTPHSDVGQDAQGRQVLCWHWEDSQVNAVSFACGALNKGLDIAQPVEVGGGLRILDTVQITTVYDAHFGCNWIGQCVSEVYGGTGNGGLTAYKITTVTAATPCAITTDQAHGYSTGNLAIIAGGEGITSINSQFTITVTGATTFTLDGHTCSGVYAANTARVTTAGAATARSHRQELTSYRIGDSVQTHRVAIHRSKNYDFPNYSDAFGYYAGPRASVSRSGRYIAYASNMGNPEWPSVYMADLGFGTLSVISTAIDPAATSAVINYVVPSGQGSAAITVSTAASLASPVVSASDGLTVSSRQYVATGLTANTLYYYRVQTTGFAYTGQFMTTPTLSGNGRLQVSKGGGGVMQYGTTTSFGSSCTYPCDISIAKGLVYTDSTGSAKAIVVK